MKTRFFSAVAFASVAIGTLPVLAHAAGPAATTAMHDAVSGAATASDKNIVENITAKPQFSTLAGALKESDFQHALTGKGPITVFAPDNAAFTTLPAGTLENLEKPENKVELATILSYHVVAGDYDAAKIKSLIKKGHGQAKLQTITGGTLTLIKKKPSGITIKDEKGNVADVTMTDLPNSNGVIHVLDKVLMPAI